MVAVGYAWMRIVIMHTIRKNLYLKLRFTNLTFGSHCKAVL